MVSRAAQPCCVVGGVAVAWFPQMWAAALLLNGRLLRENALQGAEQLGVQIVTALNGGLCPFRVLAGACSQGLYPGDWLVKRPRGVTPKKAPSPPGLWPPCPRSSPLVLSRIRAARRLRKRTLEATLCGCETLGESLRTSVPVPSFVEWNS